MILMGKCTRQSRRHALRSAASFGNARIRSASSAVRPWPYVPAPLRAVRLGTCVLSRSYQCHLVRRLCHRRGPGTDEIFAIIYNLSFPRLQIIDEMMLSSSISVGMCNSTGIHHSRQIYDRNGKWDDVSIHMSCHMP